MDLFKKYKGFTIFYLLVIIANLLFFTILTEYRMVSKPLIMGSLIGFYIGTVTKQSPSFILAMIFALLGDIFLMIDGDDFFLLGLGSFLIMQIGYAFNFYQDRQHNSQKVTTITTVILLVATSIIGWLWQDLGSLRIPVIIYTLAICTMVITAINRKPDISWHKQVIIGVILFLLSDSLIALTKFGNFNENIFKYLIMATYMIGQYLIVRGVIEQKST